MRFERRKWRPFRDERGVVHLATRLTKKEAEYLFRLADMVRTLVSCGSCMAKAGEHCRRKRDGQMMANHTHRVTHARALVTERYEPLFDRLHQPLCVVDTDDKYVVHVAADGREIDCMACLVISTSA
jgi:hypothetical protein